MKHDIPTAAYVSVTDYEEAIRAIKSFSYPVVLKADGLYQGKGVVIATDFEEAKEVLYQMLEEKSFGDAGGEVVIEEFLEGDEQSLLCFVSNNHLVAMETARDYKKIGEGDVGENTGGVGCFSPSEVNNPEDIKKVKVILEKIEQGLKSDGFEFYVTEIYIDFRILEHVRKSFSKFNQLSVSSEIEQGFSCLSVKLTL